MAHPQIAAFARLAEGNAKAIRKIEGQKTQLCRTMHSIVYDEVHDEIVVPQPFGQAILTFRGGANGEEAPLRVIQGPSTQLRNPAVLTVDPVHNEIFVPEGDAILVFPREGSGDVAPIRILYPGTRLSIGGGIAVDPLNNLLVVSASGTGREEEQGQGSSARLLIFNRTDQGHVQPRAVIAGPKTGLASISRIQVYPPRGEIIAAIPGRNQEISTSSAFVGIWSIHDNGDIPPRWTIGGPQGMLKKPRGVTLDPKNKTLMVSDKYLNAVLTYYFPEIF